MVILSRLHRGVPALRPVGRPILSVQCDDCDDSWHESLLGDLPLGGSAQRESAQSQHGDR